jgi:hypothetical protein
MVATAAFSQPSIMEHDENSFSDSSDKLHDLFRFIVRTFGWALAKPSRIEEEDDDVSVNIYSNIGEWDQQQTLLLRIVKALTLLSSLA